MKKLAAWFRLSLVTFIVCAFAISVTAGQYGDFTYSDDGTNITITKYTGSSETVIIPATINGKTVKAIGDYAFQDNSDLKGVTIPAGVTIIGSYVFKGCVELSNVAIGNNVGTINNYAFQNCYKLEGIAIPDSVKSINNGAFDGCKKLSSVNIGNGINTLGSNAFANCPYLTGVYFSGNAPTGLGSSVFLYSDKVTVYYLAGTTGWSTTFGGRPTACSGKSSQTISFPALPGKSYGDADFAPGASASSKLTVTYTSSDPLVATIVAGKIHIVGAGTAIITASQPGNADWNAAPSVQQTLIVGKRNQTINFPVLPAKTYGNADFAPGATANSGLPVSYGSANPAVATIVNGNVHITGVGTSTITASQTGNANCNAATPVTQTLTVAMGTPVITWPNPAPIVYGTLLSSTQLNAIADIPGVFVYSPAAGGKLSAGSKTLNVTFTPTDSLRYGSAGKSVSLTVNKAAATVTITGLSQTYSGQPQPVSITTVPEGLNVNITYAGGADIPVNVGSYAVIAMLNDINFEGSKSGTLVIAKANQTIIFSSLSGHAIGDADFNPASATSNLPVNYISSVPEVATIVNGKIHITGIGTSTITGSQAGDDNWNAATPVEKILTVEMGTQTITFPVFPIHNMGDANFSPDATVNSGLPLTYASSNLNVATIVDKEIHITGIGTSSISAYQAGDNSWNPAAEVMQELTVIKGDQTVNFPDLPGKNYGDEDFSPGATASSKLPVIYNSSIPEVATFVNGKIHITGAGTSAITASQTGNANWNPAPEVTQILTVAKGTPVLTWAEPAPIVYGTLLSSTQLNATANIPGVFAYSPSASTKLPYGIHNLTVNFTPTDTVLYASTEKSVSLTVSKVSATINITGLSQIYNGQPRPATVTTVPANLNVNITYAGSADAPINADSYAVIATVDDISFEGVKTGTLLISKASQTINFPVLPGKNYGDADFAPGATASSGLPITCVSSNPDVASIISGKIHILSPGTSTITASQAGDANWNPAPDVSQNLIASKGVQTITFPALPGKNCGDADFAPGATASSGLIVTYSSSNPDVASIVTGLIHIIAPGTSTITASQPGDANWEAANKTRELNVSKSVPTITWPNPAPIVYGTLLSPTQLNATANIPGIFAYSPPANSKLPVGAQTLNLTFTPTNTDSYAAAEKSVPLIVSGAAATLTITPLAQTYTGTPRPVTVTTIPSGLIVNTTYKNSKGGSVSTAPPVDIGKYTVEATVNDPNASGKKTDTLVISKGAQTITLPELSGYVMGDDDFKPGTVNSGLLLTYASSVPSVATIVKGKIHIVGQGSTMITAKQAGNANWNAATPVKQALTVDKGSQTISFPPLPDKSYGDANFAPGATAASKLTVTYTSSAPLVATIVSGKIHITGAGTVTITAKQAGNKNWNAATDAVQILSVKKGEPVITWANPKAIVYGKLLSATQLNAKANIRGKFEYSPPAGTKLDAGIHLLTAIFTPTDGARYESAEKSVSLTVNNPAAKITFTSLNQVYNDQPRSVITPQNDLLGMQTFLDIRNGRDEGEINPTYEEMWINDTILAASGDPALLCKLEEGLYMFFYGVEDAIAGNNTTVNPTLSTVPLVVHVSSTASTLNTLNSLNASTPSTFSAVLSNLNSLGLIDDDQMDAIISGRKIGIVTIAALSNPEEGVIAGDKNISLLASEHLEILANLAAGNGVFLENRNFPGVITKKFSVELNAGTRTLNVLTSAFLK